MIRGWGTLKGLFSSFPNENIQIEIDKSVDGVLGTQTRGGRIECTDESTELWRNPRVKCLAAVNVVNHFGGKSRMSFYFL